jgi:hypothetical protein
MPSPLPGMDPYIEALNIWSDFHGEGGTHPTASSRINLVFY